MAININGSVSGVQADVGATSRALKVTLYDNLGNTLVPDVPASFLANLNLTSGTAAAAAALWAVTNPTGSGKDLYIKNIRGALTWAGTAVAGATYSFEWIRYSGNVNPTTGTTVGRVKKLTTSAASVVADANIQQKVSALTLAATFDTSGSLHVMHCPVSVTGTVRTYDIDYAQGGFVYEPMRIAPGEGLALRVIGTTQTAGLTISGSVEWDER